jgi:hypothetical protein
LLGALIQAALFTVTFCAVLALRLHGERSYIFVPAAIISFTVFFAGMFLYHLHYHRRDWANNAEITIRVVPSTPERWA